MTSLAFTDFWSISSSLPQETIDSAKVSRFAALILRFTVLVAATRMRFPTLVRRGSSLSYVSNLQKAKQETLKSEKKGHLKVSSISRGEANGHYCLNEAIIPRIHQFYHDLHVGFDRTLVWVLYRNLSSPRKLI